MNELETSEYMCRCCETDIQLRLASLRMQTHSVFSLTPGASFQERIDTPHRRTHRELDRRRKTQAQDGDGDKERERGRFERERGRSARER